MPFIITVIRGCYFHWAGRRKHISVKPKRTTVPLSTDTKKLLSHISSSNLIVMSPAISQGGSLVLSRVFLLQHSLLLFTINCSPALWSSWTYRMTILTLPAPDYHFVPNGFSIPKQTYIHRTFINQFLWRGWILCAVIFFLGSDCDSYLFLSFVICLSCSFPEIL